VKFDYAARLDLPVFAFATGYSTRRFGFWLLPAARASRTISYRDERYPNEGQHWTEILADCSGLIVVIEAPAIAACAPNPSVDRDAVFPEADRGAVGFETHVRSPPFNVTVS